MTDSLRLIPLGGYGEIGKNLTVLECRGEILIVDVGIAFPDEEQSLGAELLLPNFSYLRRHADRVVGIILTHGHEDHIGGLPYLLREVPATLYGTPLTLGLVRVKLQQNQVEVPEMVTIERGDRFSVGLFDIECIRVNHSIPDCLAFGIRTPVGTVVHSGDFKFDHTPVDGEVTDFAAFARLGDEGVRLLISDSTNIDKPGHTPSEATVGEAFRRIFPRAPGRVVVATFASQIHRIQQVFDVAAECGRRVLVSGRSMERNVAVARELGYLRFEDSWRIGYGELASAADDHVVILVTGSQGEPVSGLTRMAKGSHPKLRLHPDDTVILSATPIPGNEATIWRIINLIHRSGAEVVDHRGEAIHVSGHASQEEIKLLFSLVRPEFAVPYHGEFRHMRIHGEMAQDLGLAHDHVFLLQNGDVLRLDADGAALEAPVEHGTWTVEGRRVNELGTSDQVVRDRVFLAESGVIVGALVYDVAAGELRGRPRVSVRGVRMPSEDADEATIMAEAAARLTERVDSLVGAERHDREAVERAARRALRGYFEKTTRTYPVLEVAILDVEAEPAGRSSRAPEPPRGATLVIDGAVARSGSLSLEDLAALPGCVVDWDPAVAAVALETVLATAEPAGPARVEVWCGDREPAVGLAADELADAVLIYGSDDEPLAPEDGGPLLLVVGGAVDPVEYAGVTRLEVTA